MSKVILYTASFPFGSGETYLENEIIVLSRHFEEIIIVPFSSSGESRVVPANCRVVAFESSFQTRLSFGNSLMLFRRFWLQELLHCSKPFYFLSHSRKWWALLKQAYRLTTWIKINLPYRDAYHYSFWMNDWALALAVLKQAEPDIDFIFRSGGFDIWNERHPGNYLPFRYSVYKRTAGVYPNSLLAERYIRDLKIFPHKVKVRYWGTPDYGLAHIPIEMEWYTIVSCSSVIELKRVHLIPEILQETGLKIKWIHFGGGPLLDSIQQQCSQLPSSVRCELRGHITNRKLHEFYIKNPVHAFITTSSTEGLPVSVQEAISYGIPVLATNVGGMKEVVNEKTGILIPADIDIKQAAGELRKMLTTFSGNEKLRQSARNFWEKNFSAETVYTEFANEIKTSRSL